VVAVAAVAGSRQVDPAGDPVPPAAGFRPEEPVAGTRGALA